MEQWNEIRRRILVEGVSRRQVQRETGMHWKTLKKVLEHSKPPGYRQERPKRNISLNYTFGCENRLEWRNLGSPIKSMNAFRSLILVMLASSSLVAQIPATTATTTKPNAFGEQKTVIRDGAGRVTGAATTSAANSFGEQKTVIRDASGRVTGIATTTKPNTFGEQKTVVRDASGRVTGSATTTKPNAFGETRNTYRDETGRVTGVSTTTKPNAFGETRTTFKDASGRQTGTATSPQPNVFGERKTIIKGGAPTGFIKK